MRERGILFSAPMVLALLAGRKTQTRRALKVQPLDILPMKGKSKRVEWVCLMERGETIDKNRGAVIRSRFGVPGDRLWVKETWCTEKRFNRRKPSRLPKTARVHYLADGPKPAWAGRTRSSMFMPRWVSRLTLELTDVRVERLQDISEADAIAEGVEPHIYEAWSAWDPVSESTVSLTVEPTADDIARHGYKDVRHIGPKLLNSARDLYFALWDTINGEGAAAKNPWVFALTFRPVEARTP